MTTRSQRLTIGAGVIAIAIAGGYLSWRGGDKAHQKTAAASQQARAVPVTLATVEKADYPVYLNSLGTVQGFNTATVRSRVDGQIIRLGFKEGQFVKQGDVLVEIDPRPFQATLDQARAKKTQDEATLANAKLDLNRSINLGQFATKQQIDTQTSNVAQLTALIAADDAAIANAQTQLDYATIRAPFDGVTGIRMVDVGNIINASAQTGVVTVAQVEPISIIFTAPEDQLPQINDALASHPPKVIAMTTDGRRTLAEGTLALVNNQVDTSSGTIRLKATFDNKDHTLWPGLSVSTRLLVATLKDALVIPDDAVQRGPNGLFVFAVDADNKARTRPIKVRASGDGKTVVEQGLAAGDRVVKSGQYRVQDGIPVTAAVADAR